MVTSEGAIDARRAKAAAARLSLGTNIGLAIVKLAVATWTGSISILAEGAHSAMDVLASGVALFAILRADRPPDEDHPFGHGKIENLSATLQGLALLGVASFIVREALHKLAEHTRPGRLGWGIAVMLLSAGVNLFVVRKLVGAAERTDSQALRADAQDHRADIFAGIGVLIGLVLVLITGRAFFDPLLAILVAVLIIVGALRLVWEGAATLIDTQLPPEEVAKVQEVLETDPNVLSYHNLRTRKSGSTRHVDAHILMEDDLSLLQAHDFTEALEDRIRQVLPNTNVTIHTEPFHAERVHQFEAHGGPPIGR